MIVLHVVETQHCVTPLLPNKKLSHLHGFIVFPTDYLVDHFHPVKTVMGFKPMTEKLLET